MKVYSRFGKNIFVLTGMFTVLFFLFGACQSPMEVPLSLFEEAQPYFEFVMINEDFFVSEEEVLNDPEQNGFFREMNFDGAQFTPIIIRRVVTSIDRTFSYEFENNDIVNVTMIRTIEAELRMRGTVRGSDGVSMVIKEFSETAERRAKFTRVSNTGIIEDDWKLTAISLMDGGTQEREFAIAHIKMEIRGGRTFDFTDPLDTYLQIGNTDGGVPAANLTQFRQSGFRLEITVESKNPDPETLFLRHGGVFAGGRTDAPGYMRRARIPFESEQEGANDLYVRTYVIDWTPFADFAGVVARGSDIKTGRLSAIVEVVSHDSFHDTAASVQTNYWGVPFIIQ